ncbi:MAG: SpoIIIAH-like family protein [Clostridia bacterium]|nr:SpoIIIAH-like family protein [Clostridia bacterium]
MSEEKNIIKISDTVGKLGSKMKKINWKKHIKKDLIVLSSVALIGGAVYLNWSFFKGEDKAVGNTSDIFQTDSAKSASATAGDDYFSETVLTRQRARDESMEVLSLIIDDENSLEEAKNDAMVGLNKIASEIEAEANIETLVMSKGFEDCVAVISDGSASVIVKSDELLDTEITQIQEIVLEQSGIAPTNLKIIQK